MDERILKVTNDKVNEIVRKLRKANIEIVQRTGNTIVIRSEADIEMSDDLLAQLEAVDTTPMTIENLDQLTVVSDKDIGVLALQLRQTPAFKQRLLERTEQDMDWGKFFEQY
ncbi:MAG: hypothetical protein JKX81_04810 [Arenicella sp.]|nr:hypothetical protein [Arenicella sp.]